MLMSTVFEQLREQVEVAFASDGSGHDWWHIHRVIANAEVIAQREGADLEIVKLGALLHDIADHKFHNGDLEVGPRRAAELLRARGADARTVERVVSIVNEVTFKGAGVSTPVSSIEAACVQDADRLDAIGAVGIARAFAYGGSKNRLMHNPDASPKQHQDFADYANDTGATTNHFYEKLLLLKDRMQTATGRQMAEERHRFMEVFLKQFYAEWEGRA